MGQTRIERIAEYQVELRLMLERGREARIDGLGALESGERSRVHIGLLDLLADMQQHVGEGVPDLGGVTARGECLERLEARPDRHRFGEGLSDRRDEQERVDTAQASAMAPCTREPGPWNLALDGPAVRQVHAERRDGERGICGVGREERLTGVRVATTPIQLLADEERSDGFWAR